MKPDRVSLDGVISAIQNVNPLSMKNRPGWEDLLDQATVLVMDHNLDDNEVVRLGEALQGKYKDLADLARLAGEYPAFVPAFRVLMDDLGFPGWELPAPLAQPVLEGRQVTPRHHRTPAAA